MIIEEVRDLMTVPQGYYLAHCISADCSLGGGIAKTIDEIFNMRYYLLATFGEESKHKNLTLMNEFDEVGGEAVLCGNVFNLVTKKNVYDKPTYKNLTESLLDMRQIMCDFGIKKIAMPQIGCGLDMLDWGIVTDIINEVFTNVDCTILICYLTQDVYDNDSLIYKKMLNKD